VHYDPANDLLEFTTLMNPVVPEPSDQSTSASLWGYQLASNGH
jgi:hypothetical protein